MNRVKRPNVARMTEQSEKFVNAARALGAHESEAKFDAALAKVARHKPPLVAPLEKPRQGRGARKAST